MGASKKVNRRRPVDPQTARVYLGLWKIDDRTTGSRTFYNQHRPHSALGYRPPAPQTIIAQRDDPPFATEGLRADRPFRQSPTNVN